MIALLFSLISPNVGGVFDITIRFLRLSAPAKAAAPIFDVRLGNVNVIILVDDINPSDHAAASSILIGALPSSNVREFKLVHPLNVDGPNDVTVFGTVKLCIE